MTRVNINSLAERFLQSTVLMIGTDETEALTVLGELNMEHASAETRSEFNQAVFRLAQAHHIHIDGKAFNSQNVVDTIIHDEMSGTDADLALALFYPESHELTIRRDDCIVAGLLSGVERVFEEAANHPFITLGVVLAGVALCIAFPALLTVAALASVAAAVYLGVRAVQHAVEACDATSETRSFLETRHAGAAIGEIIPTLVPLGLKRMYVPRQIPTAPATLTEQIVATPARETSIDSQTLAVLFTRLSTRMRCFFEYGDWQKARLLFQETYALFKKHDAPADAYQWLMDYVVQFSIERVHLVFQNGEEALATLKHLQEIIQLTEAETHPTQTLWGHLLPLIDHVTTQAYDFALRDFIRQQNRSSLATLLNEIRHLKITFLGNSRLTQHQMDFHCRHLRVINELLGRMNALTAEAITGSPPYRAVSDSLATSGHAELLDRIRNILSPRDL